MLLLTLALVPFAAAYTLSGSAWSEGRMPIEIHWTGDQDGFTHAALQAAVEGAAAAWTDAAPCSFRIVVVEDANADSWFQSGGNALLFGDPGDILTDGALGITVEGTGPGGTFESNGLTFNEAPPKEIIFNNGDFWVSDTAIDSGDCAGQASLQGALTHHIGRLIGLSESCSEGEACTEAGTEATMYWAMPICDSSWSTLGSDDIDGLNAIYGDAFPFAFSCAASEPDGFTAECAITEPADASALGATWDFGDGQAGSGDSVSHTYAEAGSYTIQLCIQPPDCADPRCQTAMFVAAAADSDTGTADDSAPPDETGSPDTDEKAATGCGCATGEGGGSLLAGVLGMLAIRRRRS